MNGNIDFMQEVFCFTGKMEMTRYEMWAAVEHRGGEYVRDINEECTCLVYGLKPGSKFKKAQQMGIKMMSSTDFMALLHATPRNDGDDRNDLYVTRSRERLFAEQQPQPPLTSPTGGEQETPHCDVSTEGPMESEIYHPLPYEYMETPQDEPMESERNHRNDEVQDDGPRGMMVTRWYHRVAVACVNILCYAVTLFIWLFGYHIFTALLW
jgi:hypothetical protein